MLAERIDGGRFADPGRAGDAEPHRLAGVRQKILHELPRRPPVIGAPALDQRNGARNNSALACTNAAREFRYVGLRSCHQRRTAGALPLSTTASAPPSDGLSAFARAKAKICSVVATRQD